MDRLDHLVFVTAATPCPACSSGTLELVLRCELGATPCLATAHCEACRATFRIDTEHALDAACPRCAGCGSERMRLLLRCDVVTHECTEVRVCAACRAVDVGTRTGG